MPPSPGAFFPKFPSPSTTDPVRVIFSASAPRLRVSAVNSVSFLSPRSSPTPLFLITSYGLGRARLGPGMRTMKRKITLTINGKTYTDEVEPRLLLIHYLREVAGLTGPHIGCETSICGACTVMLDGKAVKSCTMFAVQADGREILTIEGLAAKRQARSHPGGLLERARPPMRILHARHDPHARQASSGRQSPPHRARDPPRPRRQSLPLHRLPAHRQRGQSRGAKQEVHNHGHHHHQTRNPRRQAPPPPGRPAPHHRHRHSTWTI